MKLSWQHGPLSDIVLVQRYGVQPHLETGQGVFPHGTDRGPGVPVAAGGPN